jgi:hypothetical protein
MVKTPKTAPGFTVPVFDGLCFRVEGRRRVGAGDDD